MPAISRSHCYIVVEKVAASSVRCKVCGDELGRNEIRVRFYKTRTPSSVHGRCVSDPRCDGILGCCTREDFLAIGAGVPETLLREIETSLGKLRTTLTELKLIPFKAPYNVRLPSQQVPYTPVAAPTAPPAVAQSAPEPPRQPGRLSLSQHREILAKLPSHYAFAGSKEALSECAICLDSFGETTELTRLPCMCEFHKACIAEWLQKKPCCPNDLSDVSTVLIRGDETVYDLT